MRRHRCPLDNPDIMFPLTLRTLNIKNNISKLESLLFTHETKKSNIKNGSQQ